MAFSAVSPYSQHIDQAGFPFFFLLCTLFVWALSRWYSTPLGRTSVPDWTLCPSREPLACSLPSSLEAAFFWGGAKCFTNCICSRFMCFRRRMRDRERPAGRQWCGGTGSVLFQHYGRVFPLRLCLAMETLCVMSRQEVKGLVLLPDWQVWHGVSGPGETWTVNRQLWQRRICSHLILMMHKVKDGRAACEGQHVKGSCGRDRGESVLHSFTGGSCTHEFRVSVVHRRRPVNQISLLQSAAAWRRLQNWTQWLLLDHHWIKSQIVILATETFNLEPMMICGCDI